MSQRRPLPMDVVYEAPETHSAQAMAIEICERECLSCSCSFLRALLSLR